MPNLSELVYLENRIKKMIENTPEKTIYQKRVNFLKKKYSCILQQIEQYEPQVIRLRKSILSEGSD